MSKKKIDTDKIDMDVFEFQRECAKLGVPVVMPTPGLSYRETLEIVRKNQKKLTSKEFWNF